MAQLRSRPTANKSTSASSTPPSSPTHQHDVSPTSDPSSSDEQISRLPSPLDILRLTVGLLILSTALSYFITSDSLTWGYRPPWTQPARIKAWLKVAADVVREYMQKQPSTTSPHMTKVVTS
ncbi:MAG: hypothetical protein L6R40_001550 [Gallowayella cf. fulva]|nr:MAG: hypothetical protein L6R40_001550 [Xanthomendoza cf. fulva]